MKRTSAAAAAVAAAALLLAACGGSAVTKHDIVARANAICASSLRQARALVRRGSADAAYYGQLAVIVGDEAKKLRGLPRPAQDRAVLDLFVASVGKAAGQYRQLRTAAQRGDQAQVSRLTARLAASPETTYADSYGLRECAGTSGTRVSG